MFSTSVAVGAAAHGGALDHRARLVHTPAEAGGGPALHGPVAALLVTLWTVVTELGDSTWLCHLAFGLDQRG